MVEPSSPPTHVIFDLDGVLLDTEPLYTLATQAIARRYGKTFDWSVKGNMIGRGTMDAAGYLVAALGLPMSAEQYLAERDSTLRTLFPGAAEIPGAEAFTRGLHERGVGLAVATSTDRALFELKVERRRAWFSIFSVVVCGDDPRLGRGKPDPQIFLIAAGDVGADPACCLVFEDSPAGVMAARAAGMRVVAMPDPHMDLDCYPDADLVIRSFGECSLARFGF